MVYINIISGSKQVKGSLKVRGRKGLTKTECFIALELREEREVEREREE